MKKFKLNIAILLSLGVLLSSCEKDEPQQSTDGSNPEDQKEEIADYTQTGERVIYKIYNQNQSFELLESGDLLLDDVIFTKEQLDRTNSMSEKGTIYFNNNDFRKWPQAGNGLHVVHYAIGANVSNRKRITDAIKEWHSKTRVRFVPRTNQVNFVAFTENNNGQCFSNIGKVGGKQVISISPSCSTGNVIHEMGHTVGLLHEQQSPNRDDFVNIKFENIQSGKESNFARFAATSARNSSFDFGSIMMYGPTFFSKNGNPTITRKNGSSFSIQRKWLSQKDIDIIKLKYP